MGEYLLAPACERIRWWRACARSRPPQDRRVDRDQWLARPHFVGRARKARCAMSIPDHARANFATLLRAAADGNVALMECSDAVTRRGALRHLCREPRRHGFHVHAVR